jgi:RNA polymerase sigma-70 factor (ECF subfamily)
MAAFESRRSYDRSFAGARPWLYGVALNRLRRYRRSRPAEDLVPDMTSLANGWDPWPAVDARVDTRWCSGRPWPGSGRRNARC